MLLTAVARFSSGGVAIRYIFPVLWMTSYLHITGTMEACVCRCSEWRYCVVMRRLTPLPRRIGFVLYWTKRCWGRLSCFLSRFCHRRLYKSLLTENTVATQNNSSASINTNKAKTKTKSITVVDTWYWSINKISYLPLNKNYQ